MEVSMPMYSTIFRKIQAITVPVFCALLCASAFANVSLVSITDGWVRETPPGVRNAAAFLTLNNSGSTDKKLVDVQCAASLAAHCELHEHLHSANGMRMQKVSAPLMIPAGSSVKFAPGGYHVMLLDLANPLLAGSTVELLFVFDDQSTSTATLPVKPVSRE
jgi:copper(I)-binding protein